MDKQVISQENQCPSCSGRMSFDPKLQKVVCDECGETYSDEPIASGEVNKAKELLSCPNCAAELDVIIGTRQIRCEFCDSVFSVLEPDQECELTGDIPPHNRLLAPFSITEEEYRKGMLEWLTMENLTPLDVFEKVGIIRSGGYYVPHYYCVASFVGTFTAIIGIDRVETYVVMQPVTDANGKTKMQPVTKTRIVTDWYPHAGSVSNKSLNLVHATSYVKDMNQKVTDSNTTETLRGVKPSSGGMFDPINHVDLAKKTVLEPQYTVGFDILPFETHASTSYDKNKIKRDIDDAIKAVSPGDRIRNIKFTGNIVPEYFMVYLPYWATIYSYKDRICYHLCDGTDNRRNYGTRPIDKNRKRTIRFLNIAAALPVVFTIIFYIIYEFLWIESFLSLTIGTLILAIPITTGSLVVRWHILSKDRKIRTEKVSSYINNTSTFFNRRSAKADPLR